jgi:hypothetical protein
LVFGSRGPSRRDLGAGSPIMRYVNTKI